MNDIFTEWFNESAENQSLTAQERLILEVTEAIYSRMKAKVLPSLNWQKNLVNHKHLFLNY